MDIIDSLLAAKDASRVTRDLVGKITGVAIAPVHQVFEDDTIKVLLPETGGRSPSPPLYRALPVADLTYPAVRIGDTVVYGFIEGNPNKGVYWGVLHNAVNPPDDLTSYSLRVGNCISKTTPDLLSQYHTTNEQGNDASGIVITTSGVKTEKKGTLGASITVLDGSIVLKAGTTTVTISQAGITWTGGGSLDMQGLTSASINGNQITTLGAKDTRNDTLVLKGW